MHRILIGVAGILVILAIAFALSTDRRAIRLRVVGADSVRSRGADRQAEARRAIAQGGVVLDGAKVEDDATSIAGSLPGGVSVLRRGKKTLAGLFVAGV